MKYLKSFEGNIIRKYWRVRITEPYFEISMKKIGASDLYESMITNENFLDYKNNQKNKNKVYIIYSTNNNSCKFKWIYFDKYIKDNYDESKVVKTLLKVYKKISIGANRRNH